MHDWLLLLPSLIAGVALGGLHFGGLWLTVQRLPQARQPALLALGSSAVRLGVTLLGIYFVTGGHWAKIGVCLLGFFLVRVVLARRWGLQGAPAAEGGGSGGTQP